MSLKLNTKYLEGFVSEHEYEGMAAQVTAAHNTLVNRNGLGNDFLGWVTLPEDYDKEEFARIKAAAARIKEKCDVLIVIGIGGSYLGARAAIELLKSPFYNNFKKDTPDIYFVGNNISSAYLNEVLSICEGRDICVNVISKSGTTTEPALAFRISRSFLKISMARKRLRQEFSLQLTRLRALLSSFLTKRAMRHSLFLMTLAEDFQFSQQLAFSLSQQQAVISTSSWLAQERV